MSKYSARIQKIMSLHVGKLRVYYNICNILFVISKAKFLNKLYMGRLKAMNSRMLNFEPLNANN